MWVDLRLMGVCMKRERMSDMIAQLEPWAIGGFSIMFVSGFLLLLSEPLKCYTTLAFRLKAVMLVLAASTYGCFTAVFIGRLLNGMRPKCSPGKRGCADSLR